MKKIDKKQKHVDAVRRYVREEKQQFLIELEPDYREHWWNMPQYSNDSIKPHSSLTVNFATAEDRREFAEKLDAIMTSGTSFIWYPAVDKLPYGRYYYAGPKAESRYPICIPSKGRYDVQTTGRMLDTLGVSYKFFVEETEGDKYIAALGEDKVVVMPFHDLGQGSVPARNFIWDWAKEREFKRHWVLDDNIKGFTRANHTRKLRVYGGAFFQAMEDFVDRYENIAMAGPHEHGFVKPGWANTKPYNFNTRVYSCILLDTNLPYRWRGRYNEDTDLSLRLLKDGYCTCVFNALMMVKGATAYVKTHKPMKGGNTDNVYNTNDHRLAFAQSLKEQHPDCVEITWKYNRWHHKVDYTLFKNNKPKFVEGLVPVAKDNDYGMYLAKRGDQEELDVEEIDTEIDEHFDNAENDT